MFWPMGECLVYISTNLSKLSTSFPDLFHIISNTTSIAPSFDVCAHIPLTFWVPTFYVVFMATAHRNPWCNSRHLCCHCAGCWFPHGVRTTTCASFKHIQLYPLTIWHCVHQKWHSHLRRHCHCQPNTSEFTSLILCHLKICCFQCGSSQRTKLLRPTPYQSIPPFSSGGI
jgi:hypothetical protein